MIKIKRNKIKKIHGYTEIPIVPEEIVNEEDLKSITAIEKRNFILSPETIKKTNYESTGCYQDLNEDIIRKVYEKSGLYGLNLNLLKNIPKDIIIDIVKSKPMDSYSKIVFNPVFKDKYIKWIDNSIVNKLLSKESRRMLLYKTIPKDFDIKSYVWYDDKYIYYKDEFFDYYIEFPCTEFFIRKAEFDSKETIVKVADVALLNSLGYIKEAFEKAKCLHSIRIFINTLPVSGYKVAKDVIDNYIQSLKPEEQINYCIAHGVPIPSEIEVNKNTVQSIYFKGEEISYDELLSRCKSYKIQESSIKKKIYSLENSLGKLTKIFVVNGAIGDLMINFHFKKGIYQFKKKITEDFGRTFNGTFNFLKIPGKPKQSIKGITDFVLNEKLDL